MLRTNCNLCGKSNLQEIIDLGVHPFADSFIPADRLDMNEKVFPLILDACLECSHVQTRVITKAENRYRDVDYSYSSSNSRVARSHWESFASSLGKRLDLNDAVFEIGSNDGYLLDCFAKLGYVVSGVDASPKMVEISKNGAVDCDIFTNAYSLCRKEKYRLVVANNVFNHADDPLDFAMGVKNMLLPDGVFVFELPYWIQGIKEYRFDQIYHEHVSYFTVTNSVFLFGQIGLHVNDVEFVDYHGGSIRVFVSFDAQRSSRVDEYLASEKAFLNSDFHAEWGNRVRQNKEAFLDKLPVGDLVGIGAAAKGNTFLNYYDLDNNRIQFVTDVSDEKIGKYTPKTRIPIVHDSKLADFAVVHAIILSWNLSSIIKASLLEINPSIIFLEQHVET